VAATWYNQALEDNKLPDMPQILKG